MPSASLRSYRPLALVAALAIVLATLAVGLTAAPPAGAAQPAPGHSGLVPSTPRTNTPWISSGEIWDIEVGGQRCSSPAPSPPSGTTPPRSTSASWPPTTTSPRPR